MEETIGRLQASSAHLVTLAVEGGETVIVGVNQFTDDSEGLSIPLPDYAGMERGDGTFRRNRRVTRSSAWCQSCECNTSGRTVRS